MRKKRPLLWALALALVALGLVACNDDSDNSWILSGPCIRFENRSAVKNFVQSGTFAALETGASTSFSFAAARGQRLMLATMYSYSNDLFVAPANPGIALYNESGEPLTGVVADALQLWDNGTRLNEIPGPALVHPGQSEQGVVTAVVGNDPAGIPYPAASELLEVSLSYDAQQSLFTCTLTNRSASTTHPTPFSGGVYCLSNILEGALLSQAPLFEQGKASSTQLTALAEAGESEPLADELEEQTDIITSLAGAVVVVYSGKQNPLYQLGVPDSGQGLSLLAQRGDPSQLVASLGQLPQVKRIYSTSKSILPGQYLECFYWANPDEKIAYALMFGYSNDWFFANGADLWALQAGDVTEKTLLLDDGTALSQYPGAGNAQWLFGGTAIPEQSPITRVGDDRFPVPDTDDLIRVTIY